MAFRRTENTLKWLSVKGLKTMRLLTIASAIAVISGPAAYAAPGKSPDTNTEAVATPVAKPAKEKKICRLAGPVTGSRLSGRRICRTADEWAEIESRDTEMGRIPGARAVPPPVKPGPGR
jgi:hypothetical protein